MGLRLGLPHNFGSGKTEISGVGSMFLDTYALNTEVVRLQETFKGDAGTAKTGRCTE